MTSVERIFDYFREINNVPRPSKHEEKMIAFMEDFAAKNNFDCKKDAAGNLLISRPAAAGCEAMPTIVLQGHMDMVCEKNSDCNIDFMNDPIETYVDGEWMRAKGTTLGADDGIGIAMGMAMLTDNDLKCGRIELLCTVDEETGLTGAFALEPGFMSGKYLINLDSEDEGEIFVGCAGGANTQIVLPAEKEELRKSYFAMKVCVDKLRGGHSGDDINKHRANAIKTLTRFLYQCAVKYDLRICDIKGGNLHNAIPRSAEAIIAVPFTDKENVRVDFNIFASDFENEYPDETEASFFLESTQDVSLCLKKEVSEKLIAALQAVHNGVMEMSVAIPGLVETSSNLASIHLVNDEIKIVTSQRSSITSQRKAMSDTVAAPFRLIGAEVKTADGYPGWKPNPDSELLKVATEEYVKLFGKEPKIKAIHAGLECGLFSEKYPGLDMISVGPTLRGVHSPDERLHIPTVEMVWKHLVAIVETLGRTC